MAWCFHWKGRLDIYPGTLHMHSAAFHSLGVSFTSLDKAYFFFNVH